MGIALDIYKKSQYEEGFRKGYAVGYKKGLEESRRDFEDLEKRVA